MTIANPQAESTSSSAARLRADVLLAARLLPVARPLADFVAVNPLSGFEHLPFDEAIRAAADLYGTVGHLGEDAYRALVADGRITAEDVASVAPAGTTLDELLRGPAAEPPGRRLLTPVEQHDRAMGTDLLAAVDAHAVRWCAPYLDQGQASWTMPGRHHGLYPAWRALVPLDPGLPGTIRRRLEALPSTSDEALAEAIDAFAGCFEDRRDLLAAEVTALPGWAAHIRWRAEAIGDVTLIDYLALRLSFGRALLGPAVNDLPRHRSPRPATDPGPIEPGLVWQAALEHRERVRLLGAISTNTPAEVPADRPDAQLVCCIDVRSEGLRRQFEALGNYETLGFAGFFAVAIEWQPLTGGTTLASCPALISPRHRVDEGSDDDADALVRYRRQLSGIAAGDDAVHMAKDTPGAAFVLAEAAGWLSGPAAAARTLAPRQWASMRRRSQRRLVDQPTPTVDLDRGFPMADRITTAKTALRMMGLTKVFAPLVVMCGHSSETAANPYEAALRCGACGGHGGGPNARVLVAILNDAEVRVALHADGIPVPDDTVFLAGEHDTTTDEVTILDEHAVPGSHRAVLDRLRRDLLAAGAACAAERCASLPGAPSRPTDPDAYRHVKRRSTDWGEAFPEWGLAGNAAFVIGPRTMTAGLDLERRVFLHSYQADADPTGLLLETILTAPLVVAQWINCQYYFSSTDPEVFGAGSKTVHNPVGTIGVLSGRTGDLRMGLPAQSVALGEGCLHEPLRLLAAVQAPLPTIAGIIERNPALRQLLTGRWITLVARVDDVSDWTEWTTDGWVPTVTTTIGAPT